MRSSRDLPGPTSSIHDELGELVAYLDNATIVNACSILANPAKFDVYKLLDLDSFFEAFLFNDRVRTLVGASFSVGFAGGYTGRHRGRWSSDLEDDLDGAIWQSSTDPDAVMKKLLSSRTNYDTGTLYRELIGAGILRPVVRSAGGVQYYVQNHEKLDAIANTIDVDATVALLDRVFDGGMPWNYDIPSRAYEGEWDVEKQAFKKLPTRAAASRAARNNVVYGEETWTSDSYPVYSFPDSSDEGRRVFDEEQRRFPRHSPLGPRKWGGNQTFAAQTFYYVAEANLHKKSYVCSSVRTPIVANLVSQLNSRFQSSVAACLKSVDAQIAQQLQAVIDFLDDGAIGFVSAPALFLVLREARNKSDIVPALFRLRQSKQIAQFRAWCSELQKSWSQHDLGKILHHMGSLKTAVSSLDDDDKCERTISHLGNLNLIVESSVRASTDPNRLLADSFSPSLVFLKDVGSALLQPGRNRQLIEDLLRHKLSNADVETARELIALRGRLYPPGKLQSTARSTTIERMELRMGDTFSNITGSTIINRSIVEDSLNKVKIRDGGEVAEVLAKATDLIEASGSRPAAQLFEQFNEELSKPEPRKSILGATWDGILKIVPAVGSIAGAAAAIAKLLS